MLTHLCLLYPNTELVTSFIITVCFFPHEERGLGLGLGFNSSSVTLAMSQVVKFYIKAILGFLTTAEDTGASDQSFYSCVKKQGVPKPCCLLTPSSEGH